MIVAPGGIRTAPCSTRCRCPLHDCDTQFSAAFDESFRTAGIQPILLPPRGPNLNAHGERWNRPEKEKRLSRMILIFGEASLRHVLLNYVEHDHSERNQQGQGNVILFPTPADRIGKSSGGLQTGERLGGRLKFHHREAA